MLLFNNLNKGVCHGVNLTSDAIHIDAAENAQSQTLILDSLDYIT